MHSVAHPSSNDETLQKLPDLCRKTCGKNGEKGRVRTWLARVGPALAWVHRREWGRCELVDRGR